MNHVSKIKPSYEPRIRQKSSLYELPLKKITLCGSTRFPRAFAEWNARLTLEGNIVYSVAIMQHSFKFIPSEEQKRILDLVHFEKIRNSDKIFVLDIDGYIGESTKREIRYAQILGKEIEFLSKSNPYWTEKDCIYY